YYRYPYVNPWPRQLQKPHPPVWCPSQGSSETVEWEAKRRFPYLMVFTPIKRIAQIYGEYREACERYGYTASRYQLTVNVPIAVAPTDAKARELAQKHVMWVFNVGLRMHPPFWRPPGYLTEASLRRLLADRKSTRLNSSHQIISYAVFCLKKKKKHTVICTAVL